MIGRVLAGRYKVVAVIGEGGMSHVWRAQDMNTGKMVAVKVLREEFRDDELFVRRFEREAQAASRMTHPNIVNLLDVGLEEDGTRYLVIEYVSGKTLKQLIQENGAIRPETASQIIMRVLAAVQHAHQNGVIHRDIKPQNILIDKEGAVKVSDFGIARLANSKTMSEDSETVMGSVYYFSPEQAKGAAVDEKSDLYSVGVVLYEMLTGQVPFTGDSPVNIAMKHIQEEPAAPSEVNPAVSPALDFVVLQAMEKRPRHRYATAAEMLRDVRLALENPDTILAARAEAERREREARLSQRKQRKAQKRVLWMRRILVGILTLILLALTAVAGYTIMERILQTRKNTVEVPNLMSLHMDTAITRLVELGLDPVVSYDVYDFVPENYVGNQSVLPGTFVEPGEKVTIFVCKSNFEIRVPNVMNIPYGQAREIIADLGLVIGKQELTMSRAEVNLVISQSLEPGALANKGDVIDLQISGGLVNMPRVIGFMQSQAEQTLRAANLVVRYDEVQVENSQDVGRVVSQIPDPFYEVMQNTTVTIVIGVPASTMYSADITLDLTEMEPGTTVTIRTPQPDGTEAVEWNQTFEAETDFYPVTLYRSSPGEGSYSVYFNDELRYMGAVLYTR